MTATGRSGPHPLASPPRVPPTAADQPHPEAERQRQLLLAELMNHVMADADLVRQSIDGNAYPSAGPETACRTG